jgi:hypothetical protein
MSKNEIPKHFWKTKKHDFFISRELFLVFFTFSLHNVVKYSIFLHLTNKNEIS